MSAAERRQGWRILEFAAKIAQEDEGAALDLFTAAANALPKRDSEFASSVANAFRGVWHALYYEIQCEEQQARNAVARKAIDEGLLSPQDLANSTRLPPED